MVMLLLIFKIIWRRKPVELSDNRAELQRAIEALRANKPKRKQRRHQGLTAQIDVNDLEEVTENPIEIGPMNAERTLHRSTVSSRNDLLNHISESGADASLGGSSPAYRD